MAQLQPKIIQDKSISGYLQKQWWFFVILFILAVLFWGNVGKTLLK
tara:strand:- start:628 stop:765 length:138 start_codon:yes stop_codon:yes gene_type:complete